MKIAITSPFYTVNGYYKKSVTPCVSDIWIMSSAAYLHAVVNYATYKIIYAPRAIADAHEATISKIFHQLGT